MQQIENARKNKKSPGLDRFSICNNDLVRQVDSRWNHFEAELRMMYEKLDKFGLKYCDGKIVIMEVL